VGSWIGTEAGYRQFRPVTVCTADDRPKSKRFRQLRVDIEVISGCDAFLTCDFRHFILGGSVGPRPAFLKSTQLEIRSHCRPSSTQSATH